MATAAKTLGIVPVVAAGGVALPGASAADTARDGSQKEKKNCRVSKMTGSLTRRMRICMTEGEWRELADRTRKGVDEMGRDASGGKMCVPDPREPYQGCPG